MSYFSKLLVESTATTSKGILQKPRAPLESRLKTMTGAEALSAAELLEPDVVLLGISMPDMKGIEVANRIRQRIHG